MEKIGILDENICERKYGGMEGDSWFNNNSPFINFSKTWWLRFFQTLPYIRADSSEWKLMLLSTSLIFYEGSMDLRETEGFQSFLLPDMMDIRSGSNNPHRNFMTIF